LILKSLRTHEASRRWEEKGLGEEAVDFNLEPLTLTLSPFGRGEGKK
jgi:hypothetical protein